MDAYDGIQDDKGLDVTRFMTGRVDRDDRDRDGMTGLGWGDMCDVGDVKYLDPAG